MMSHDNPLWGDPEFDDAGRLYDDREPDPDAKYEREVYERLDDAVDGKREKP